VALDSQTLLALARSAIEQGLTLRRPPPAGIVYYTGLLAEPGACFVSLHIGDNLRGCVGQTDRGPSLGEQLVANAYAAAFRDPRFGPLTPEELERVSIEVHVLGPLEPLAFTDLPQLYGLLRPGQDGLQLEAAQRRGVFLPIMWNELPTPQRFVAHLLRKAGIVETAGMSASRFSAEVFAEEQRPSP
jgi:AmmeMemoRadiSam system protein A